MEVVASLSQGRTAAAKCALFTHKSVPVIFEPACIFYQRYICVFHGGDSEHCLGCGIRSGGRPLPCSR